MNELRNRMLVIGGIMIVVAIIFLVKLLYMQVFDDEWKTRAQRITEASVILKPPRGVVYDRNGKLLVANQAVHDLMIIPKQVKEFDTLAFSNIIGMDIDKFKERLKDRSLRRAPHQSHIILPHVTPNEYAAINEQLHNFPGFFGQPTTMRNYPHPVGALLLGDVREVSPKHIENDSYYKPGDHVGNGGLELAYEKQLRGVKGISYFYRDNLGILHEVAEGRLDSSAVPGTQLTSTIDAELQAYGEKLMQNKKGCIVAIEPKTGEILSLVSAPSYDPGLLVGQSRGENYALLQADSLNPLYNRALKGAYRPGSIFKMIQALVALEEGVITPQTRVHCNRKIIGCHGPHTYDDLNGAIKHSCNPYFRNVMQRMVEAGKKKNRFEDAPIGLDKWKKNIMRFGLGTNLGTDIPGIRTGLVPGSSYYDKIYGEKRWAFSTIYSVSIGEGELLVTPLHMANLACIIANRGWYISPHVMSAINGVTVTDSIATRIETGISAKHFDVVVDAMETVVNEPGGTADRARIDGITVCGKTGTVQNDPIPDHSVFIAFAPKDDPKIAVAVYVEYAGFGGTWAAPIASLITEKYLTDSISNQRKEQRILDAVILDY